MNAALTFNNLTGLDFSPQAISMPKELNYSSDSFIDESDELAQRIVVERLDIVRGNIGSELFNQLSYNDKMLMANTAGVIDFGRAIDLDKVEKEIENYDYSR